MSSLLETVLQNCAKHTHALKKSLEMVTHQATPCGCPNMQIGSSSLNRSGTLQECHNLPQKNDAPHWAPIVTQWCFCRTIKSLVHALGTNSSMTEPTINLTLYAFIEQVNLYDLQKMVL